MSNLHQLDIWLEEKQVGTLQLDTETDEISLHYSPNWQQEGFALSPHLPLQENEL